MKQNTKELEKQADKLQKELDQLKAIISEQSICKYSIEDIKGSNSLEISEEILKDSNFHTKYKECQFTRKKDWISYKIETIIKAVNYIDNDYKEYKPDFNNKNIGKYLPYFQKNSSGWFLDAVVDFYWFSFGSLFQYYKNYNTAKIVVNNNIDLYNEFLNN